MFQDPKQRKFEDPHDVNRSGKPIGKSCRGRGRKNGGSEHRNHRASSVGESPQINNDEVE